MADVRGALFLFGKAQFSAWMATALDFVVTLVLGKFIGIWYATATFVGALSGGTVNCVVNYRWVFHGSDQKKYNVAMKYVLVWLVSIMLNTYGTYFVTEATGMDFIISKMIVAVLVAVFWNYQMQRIYVFKHKHIKLKNKC